MSNKDLARQLEAMRHKAKEAATSEPSQSEAAATPSTPPPELKVLSGRKPRPQKQGRGAALKVTPAVALPPDLQRTTITLKSGDNAALSELQTFLMQRSRKAASTSTLIRLALLYTKQAVASDAEALANVYTQILKGDGRRKVDKV